MSCPADYPTQTPPELCGGGGQRFSLLVAHLVRAYSNRCELLERLQEVLETLGEWGRNRGR